MVIERAAPLWHTTPLAPGEASRKTGTVEWLIRLRGTYTGPNFVPQRCGQRLPVWKSADRDRVGDGVPAGLVGGSF